MIKISDLWNKKRDIRPFDKSTYNRIVGGFTLKLA